MRGGLRTGCWRLREMPATCTEEAGNWDRLRLQLCSRCDSWFREWKGTETRIGHRCCYCCYCAGCSYRLRTNWRLEVPGLAVSKARFPSQSLRTSCCLPEMLAFGVSMAPRSCLPEEVAPAVSMAPRSYWRERPVVPAVSMALQSCCCCCSCWPVVESRCFLGSQNWKRSLSCCFRWGSTAAQTAHQSGCLRCSHWLPEWMAHQNSKRA